MHRSGSIDAGRFALRCVPGARRSLPIRPHARGAGGRSTRPTTSERPASRAGPRSSCARCPARLRFEQKVQHFIDHQQQRAAPAAVLAPLCLRTWSSRRDDARASSIPCAISACSVVREPRRAAIRRAGACQTANSRPPASWSAGSVLIASIDEAALEKVPSASSGRRCWCAARRSRCSRSRGPRGDGHVRATLGDFLDLLRARVCPSVPTITCGGTVARAGDGLDARPSAGGAAQRAREGRGAGS
jgi:hypothetical protein